MRVLHFYKSALPETFGGVEQVIHHITHGTKLFGVENIVLSISERPNLTPIYVNDYLLYTTKCNFKFASTPFSWQSFSLFKKLVATVDIVHYHYPWPFADLVHLLTLPKIPTILTYHSDIVRQKILLKFYRPIMNKFLNSVDSIIATSPNYAASSKLLNSLSDKVSIIPIGLDATLYFKPRLIDVIDFKNRFGTRFFLFIGAFRYYKGLKFLLQAAREINYPIVIVGSGPIESELVEYVSQYRLNNVFFMSNISEKDKCSLLEASYSVVFPSNLRSEAFGVTLLEGAMFGKPLISCEIGTGTTFININNVSGLTIPPSDHKALANAMTWLWTHPKEAEIMGQRAKERFQTFFTCKQMAQSYFNHYHKLLNQ